jgi:hypothetical protein
MKMACARTLVESWLPRAAHKNDALRVDLYSSQANCQIECKRLNVCSSVVTSKNLGAMRVV